VKIALHGTGRHIQKFFISATAINALTSSRTSAISKILANFDGAIAVGPIVVARRREDCWCIQGVEVAEPLGVEGIAAGGRRDRAVYLTFHGKSSNNQTTWLFPQADCQ